ncbi:carbohydrate kinase family protein [Faecalicatena contorta]|uniref:Fructokinase/fructan beta-fructosidase n=1 Tax=Faecalicatena contorta TaxID=39482 RepID=A0A316A1P9_9FIRM|nr:carbohydrate kinase [Faecalicatena contorta]PWJ51866.1 fructokinase/fructan beta-fructosidase [Faecalicatena contorta]SUQ12133.1 fructokinase/fructan beta-fructosidase [Faecalicatena contorta]
MYDLCAIGDALVDFIPAPQYTPDKPVYQCEVGGTVANALTAGSKLGLSTLFVGKIGDDCMGQLIRNKMISHGVSMEGCVVDPIHFTTQTFVSLGENGERSFSFARRFGADIWLEESDLPMERILQSSMVGFSGMCMTDEPIRSATWKLLRAVRAKEIPIVLDVNYRYNLWKNEEEAISAMRETLSYAALYKSSEEEAYLLAGVEDLQEAAEKIADYGCRIVIITLGGQGSYYYVNGESGHIPSYKVEAIDTTGAGDSFFAGLLYQIKQRGGIENISAGDYPEILKFANAAGALAATKRGGVNGAPFLNEIEEFIKQYSQTHSVNNFKVQYKEEMK